MIKYPLQGLDSMFCDVAHDALDDDSDDDDDGYDDVDDNNGNDDHYDHNDVRWLEVVAGMGT